MFDRSYLILSSWALGIMLVGCAAKKVEVSPASFVESKLMAASEAISYDLALLTGSSQRRVGYAKVEGGLGERMDFSFDGTLEEALMRVCATAGYKLKVEGIKPHTQPMISLRLRDRSCLDIFRAIGQQTGPHEGIMVKEAEQSVTLVYVK